MPPSKNHLAAVLKLPPEERARIARELIASLDEPRETETEQAWIDEIERRLQDVDAGTAQLEEWSTVRERIAARLRSL